MTDLPGPEIVPARRSLLERVSIVWLVPLAALVISLAIAWQNYASRGPLIEIAFADAEGIRAGTTELRFRDVPVGIVESVSFSPGLGSVLVGVRLDQNIAPYVDEGSEFWVVRPRVTAQGVSGLSTVLGGVYIQGSWDTEQGETPERFVGLAAAPVARPDLPGLQVVLSSETGEGLLQGTPILYRGLQVGAIADLRLAPNGQTVLAEGFIEAPYDQLITTSTRFWNASGFSFSLGPQGATLDVSSLAALVSGGVALENLVTGGEPVGPGASFQLYAGRAEALSSVFADPAADESVTVGFVFSSDVSGLSAGSPVEFQGIRIGQVAGVTGIIDEERFGDRRVRLLATAELDPVRVVFRDADDATGPPTAEEVFETLESMADSGVRARLARGSILAGGLKIVLAEEPDAEPAAFDRDAEPIPIFPTTTSELPEVADTVEGLISRVNDLPIEEMLDGVTTLLRNVNAVLDTDAVRAAPDEILGLVGDVRGLVGSEAVQQAPAEIAAILGDLQAAVTDVREVLAEFRDAGAATALTEALAASAPVIERIDQLLATAEPAVQGLPALFERLGEAATDIAAVAATAADLPLAELVDSATETARATQALMTSDAVRQVPQDLSAVLADVSATLGEVHESGLVARTGTAVDAAADAATRIAGASEDLPALIEQLAATATDIAAVARTAANLPLAELVGSATETAQAAQALVTSEAVRQVPQELASALADVSATLAEVRESGLVARTGTAIDAAADAATRIAGASEDLPALIEQLGTTATDIAAVARTAANLPLAEFVGSATETAQAAQALMTSEAVQQVPQELASVLADVSATLDEVRESQIVPRAGTAVDAAGDAAARLAVATENLPALIERVEAVAAAVEALPLAEVVAAAERTLLSADEILASEGLRAAPAELNSALGELRTVIAEIRTAGLVARVGETLAAAEETAGAIRDATAGVPEVVAGIGEFTRTANALPLDRLTSNIADFAEAAEALLATQGAQDLPASFNAALDEVQAALRELREGGLIDSANQTLASTRDAAAAVEQASTSLPDLARRLDALADQAERTLAAYSEGSELNRGARLAMREVETAARAVAALARQIERNPNSLLLGR